MYSFLLNQDLQKLGNCGVYILHYNSAIQQRYTLNCDGLASCPGELVQLHAKLLALNETRFKPSPAFMAT